MKKAIFTLIACATIFSVTSAFKSKTINFNKNEGSMTIVADKNNCTVTTTCPNGASATCTAPTCSPCHEAITAWLAGGGCNSGGNQE